MTGDLRRSVRGALGIGLRSSMRRFAGGRVPPVIAMYHRIASPPVDPWGLSVAPEIFCVQLAALRRERKVMGMADFIASQQRGDLPPGAAAITFDDGYRDTLELAAPILSEAGLPATLFLTAGGEQAQREYWWDELARLVLLSQGARDVSVAGQVIGLPSAPARPRALAHWRIEQGSGGCARRQALIDLAARLGAMAPALRLAAMAELREQLATHAPAPDPLAQPLGADAATALADSGIALGGHGCSHAPLPGLADVELAAEIEGSWVQVGPGECVGFAYPHGAFDARVRQAVEQSPFCWAVTTQGFALPAGEVDSYALPRVAVGNWSGPQLLRRLAGAPVLPQIPFQFH